MRSTFGRMLLGLVGAATAAALTVPGAFAKGPPDKPGEDPGAKFNLSVPAAFLGTNPYGLNCEEAASEPAGLPSSGFEIDPAAYYYVQGENAWRADCMEGTSAEATAAWGDNLEGDAKLKVGKPIRVEIGLYASSVDGAAVPDMTGWFVEKLEPSELDRNSAYGTLASPDGAGGFTSNPLTPFVNQSGEAETRVWAEGTWLKISPVNADGTLGEAVVDEEASAEINATGRVVYGYNLRVDATGTYEIEYTFPGVTITDSDVGTVNGPTATHLIEVVQGGGGGQGGPKGPKDR